MQKHVKNYLKARDIFPGEVVLCEVCHTQAFDIHHIVFRSQGGGDEAENLVALCRRCHNRAHGLEEPRIQVQELLDIAKKRE